MLREKLLARLLQWTESERFQYLRHLYRSLEFVGANGVGGDLMEFGVSRGASLMLLEQIADEVLRQRWSRDYRIFGFDSFQGLPASSGPDRQVHGDPDGPGLHFKEGMYAASKSDLEARIAKEAKNPDSIRLIEGFFEDSLTPELRGELGVEQVSLVTIDTDLYEPTRLVLDWIEPLITDVTILVLDDWFLYKGDPTLGQQLALNEFLEANPDIRASEFFGYAWHAQAFLLHRARPGS